MDSLKRITDTVQLYVTHHFDDYEIKSMILQYYNTIVVVLSSIISTFFADLIVDNSNNLTINKNNAEGKNKDKGYIEKYDGNYIYKKINKFLIKILCMLLSYLVVFEIAICLYAIIKSDYDSNKADLIIQNINNVYFDIKYGEIILIPTVIFFFSNILSYSNNTRLKVFLKGALCVICTLIIFVLPSFMVSEKVSVLPLESEILHELKDMPFSYDIGFYNPQHLKEMFDEGYWTDDNPRISKDIDNEKNIQTTHKFLES